jgi:3-hydroxyisobutyrate dehydrogenase
MESTAMLTIAFIGLGAMGSGMAANLVKAGHKVLAFDLNPQAMSAAVEAGAVGANSIASAVALADCVITMLPAGSHVREVYTGEDGVLVNARPRALLIDCSTISVDDARFVIAQSAVAGFDMCDAPVSGGVSAAASGALTFMVGGSDQAFGRSKDVLTAMGKTIIHAGQAGAGQAAKICNNMLLAVSMIGTCEAFVLAEKLGLDAKAFFDIASKSSGQSWSMTSYAPVAGLVPTAPSNRNFENGFAGALMLKDLRLAMDAAASTGAATPMGLRAEEIYSKYVSNHNPNRDFSGVIDMLREV